MDSSTLVILLLCLLLLFTCAPRAPRKASCYAITSAFLSLSAGILGSMVPFGVGERVPGPWALHPVAQ